MLDRLIVLDPASALTLQGQIRQRIIDNILAGTFARGRRLPSSRARSPASLASGATRCCTP